MAAFSYQHQPFLLDSIFLPNTPIKMSSLVEEENININYFSQFYPLEPTQEIPVDDISVRESNCFDHSSKGAFSDNEPSLAKKQSTESSTVVDKLDSGEQVTQKVTPMEKKRKTRNGVSLTTAQSKDPTEGKNKKQKRWNGALKEEAKKPKAEKKDQKKVSEEPPTGYIHVRARRGQATDSHSLAERVRREKISERMKILQRLVPGCDKFLSMKLASVNPMFYDYGMDLDGLIVRPERLTSMQQQITMASPLPSVTQCSLTQPTGFGQTPTASAFTTANNYPITNNSASLLLQPGQRPNAFPQDIAGIFCEAEDHRQKFLNPSGLSNNLCFLH
ncbi:hypothetical protein F2P56_003243 [Juglans regia]|uniref:BHLH domain-containing protein n=2 Tax=Juglans regia TaxID=51240 RepID=A0A833XSG4_JUGRE|nr:transcription factor bHLH137-like isoform X2 [Juglans regia]KAF5476492.1 hypothetical protein F2P56_003243 [Juglans regia]